MNNNDKILREKENNIPLNNSNMEDHWVAMEKQLLGSNAQTTKVNNGILKRIYTPLLALVAAIIIGIFAFKYFNTKPIIKAESAIAQSNSVIKPPMPKLNVPYEIFTYDAALGDTIFTKNGSILVFPKNAVLYADGNIATGIIEIQTREFNDPLDYSLAGIPMTYDSAGIKYTFVSSGMIDIKAYQNGALLKVNPNAKPQLNLVSTNNEKNTNLYVLDTTTGQWINKGKDEVNDVAVNVKQNVAITIPPAKNENTKTADDNPKIIEGNNKPVTKIIIPEENTKNVVNYKEIVEAKTKPVSTKMASKEDTKTAIDYPMNIQANNKPITKPIAPQKASGKNPTIEIKIDPASFKELLAYDNLKFEVLNSNTETVGEDSKTEWSDVALIHDGAKYIAKFRAGNKSVQYEVKPVLEGKDYDAAVALYNAKIKAYYDLQKTRVNIEQAQQDTLALQNKIIDEENKKTLANNEVVIAENKLIDAENKRIAELNVLINARNKKVEEQKMQYLVELKRQQKIIDSSKTIFDMDKEYLVAEIKKQKKSYDSIYSLWAINNKALVTSQNIIRSFQIDGFGYWNCDQPLWSSFISLNATFVDSNSNTINFPEINEAVIGINRLFVFNNNKISVLQNANHVFWAVYNNQFYFFTAFDYNKLKITKPNNATFVMRKCEQEPSSIEELRKIVYGSKY